MAPVGTRHQRTVAEHPRQSDTDTGIIPR